MINKELKVLIIEDNPVFAKQLESWLQPIVSEIYSSPNSENGSFFISQEQPNVIFLDNVLPGVNGIDVLAFFKEKSPSAKIILMSSYIDLNDALEAMQIGADYIFNKRKEGKTEIERIIQNISTENTELNSEKVGFWDQMKLSKLFRNQAITKNITLLEFDDEFALKLQTSLSVLNANNHLKINRFISRNEYKEYASNGGKTDVFILDLQLEDVKSVDLIKELKSNNIHTEIILIANELELDEVIELNLEGVSHYLLKNDKWNENFDIIVKKIGLKNN